MTDEDDNKPDYKLTDRQKRFVRKAEREGHEVDYGYSGRGMYGRSCPAVRISYQTEFEYKGASWDSMGLGYVIYMPS